MTSPRTQPRRAARRAGVIAVCALALAPLAAPAHGTAAPTTLAAASAPAADRPLIFGASGGDEVERLARAAGVRLAFHAYGQLQGRVPDGKLINMAPNIPWSTITAAQPGSSVYADVARWADELKHRKGRVMFTFSHEPEGGSSQSEGLGTADEFKAAFRRVREIFESRGVRNVEYTWNMTSNSFRVPSTDPRYAPKWYPGNKYVDNVASAAYNWYDCGEGKGEWLSLRNRAREPLRFAKQHHKQLVIAEFASQRDPRRAQWLRNAHDFLRDERAHIRGAFYYQSPTPRAGCSWMLDTDDEYQALGTIARDRRL